MSSCCLGTCRIAPLQQVPMPLRAVPFYARKRDMYGARAQHVPSGSATRSARAPYMSRVLAGNMGLGGRGSMSVSH